MNIKRSSLYTGISRISNPSIRAMVYAVVEDHWETFYDKRIAGLSGKTAGWYGREIVEAILKEVDWIISCPEWDTKNLNRDLLYAIAYLEPAWIGPAVSEKEIEGWEFLKIQKLWRVPDWKTFWPLWYATLWDYAKQYPHGGPNLYSVMNKDMWGKHAIGYDEPTVYRVAYLYALKR